MSTRSKKSIRSKKLIVADIFAGAGGLSTGFAHAIAPRSGYEVVFGVDHDRDAMRTFRAQHFPGLLAQQDDPRACCDDIDKIDAKRILSTTRPFNRVDVLIGGPSCQGVSPAGLRNPDDKRNRMLLAFARLVKELRPKWFVMENVPGLTHSNNRALLSEIFKLFEDIEGYKVAGDVLLAADYGVPQFRYRLFLIGTRTSAPIRFPSATHFSLSKADAKGSKEVKYHRTVSDAIQDLASIAPLEVESHASATKPTRGLPNHWCRGITEINRKRIAAVKNGADWRDIPIKLLPERYFTTRSSDQKGSYGRLAWDWPAYTVTNASLNISAGAFTHPDHDRCLSVREVARIQSFDDEYVFQGSIEAQYRQVGNAVPPLLAKAVAEAILYAHSNPRKAKKWGRPGRLTSKIVRDSLVDPSTFPTLTPRCTHPATARSSARKTPKPTGDSAMKDVLPSVWKLTPRPADPWPEDTKRLRVLAEQPKNMRAAKRARSIVQFIDGLPRPKIVSAANASEASVRKWVDAYFASGLEGWRAYHSGVDHLAAGNERLQEKIKNSVLRVRKLLLAPSKASDDAPVKRLHMNGYLRQLITEYGEYSVGGLIGHLEKHLGVGIGTVYVGDLLAIADAVLSDAGVESGNSAHSLQISSKGREDTRRQALVQTRR